MAQLYYPSQGPEGTSPETPTQDWQSGAVLHGRGRASGVCAGIWHRYPYRRQANWPRRGHTPSAGWATARGSMEDLRKTRGDRKGRIAIRSSSLGCRRRAVQGLRVVTSNMGSRWLEGITGRCPRPHSPPPLRPMHTPFSFSLWPDSRLLCPAFARCQNENDVVGGPGGGGKVDRMAVIRS